MKGIGVEGGKECVANDGTKKGMCPEERKGAYL